MAMAVMRRKPRMMETKDMLQGERVRGMSRMLQKSSRMERVRIEEAQRAVRPFPLMRS